MLYNSLMFNVLNNWLQLILHCFYPSIVVIHVTYLTLHSGTQIGFVNNKKYSSNLENLVNRMQLLFKNEVFLQLGSVRPFVRPRQLI